MTKKTIDLKKAKKLAANPNITYKEAALQLGTDKLHLQYVLRRENIQWFSNRRGRPQKYKKISKATLEKAAKDETITYKILSEQLGIPITCIRQRVEKLNIDWAAVAQQEKSSRNDDLVRDYHDGRGRYADVAKKYGISRQRAHAIIKREMARTNA